MNYSDFVVKEAADLGLVCVPMTLLQEQAQLGNTYNRGPGGTYTRDSDGSDQFEYASMCIPSEPSQGTYSLLYPDFPGLGPVVDSFLEETLEDFGAFHEGVPANPACSTPQPRRSPGLQRTFDIARPRGATFNAGRASDTFNVRPASNTFNIGRNANTFNVGRASNTFNVGRSPGNETYDIHEGDDYQEFPSDITHGTYTVAYPDVCFPPTPEALFNDTISSGGTDAFMMGAPAWPGQSSPKPRTPPEPKRTRPVSTPRRFIRMDRRIRSNWLPRGTGRRLNFNNLGRNDDAAGTPDTFLATFNRLSREFVNEIQCDPSAYLGIVSSPPRRHKTLP